MARKHLQESDTAYAVSTTRCEKNGYHLIQQPKSHNLAFLAKNLQILQNCHLNWKVFSGSEGTYVIRMTWQFVRWTRNRCFKHVFLFWNITFTHTGEHVSFYNAVALVISRRRRDYRWLFRPAQPSFSVSLTSHHVGVRLRLTDMESRFSLRGKENWVHKRLQSPVLARQYRPSRSTG